MSGELWGVERQEETTGVRLKADPRASIQLLVHLLSNGKGKSLWAKSFEIVMATAHFFTDGETECQGRRGPF